MHIGRSRGCFSIVWAPAWPITYFINWVQSAMALAPFLYSGQMVVESIGKPCNRWRLGVGGMPADGVVSSQSDNFPMLSTTRCPTRWKAPPLRPCARKMARDIGIYPGVRASRTPQAQAQAQRRTRPRTYTRRAQRNRAAPHPVHTVNALRTQRHEQAGHDPAAAAARGRSQGACGRRPPSAMRPPWAPPASARGSRPRPRPPSSRARWRRAGPAAASRSRGSC